MAIVEAELCNKHEILANYDSEAFSTRRISISKRAISKGSGTRRIDLTQEARESVERFERSLQEGLI